MDAAQLRQRLVEFLRRRGVLTDARVIAAFEAVPRHEFVPEATVEEAYRDHVVLTKRGTDGTPLSSASQPSIVALMLQQLAVEPGQRVLEIGAGTGYNAALLAHQAGASGSVTTMDIDTDIAVRAKAALERFSAHEVRVLTGDGGLGAPQFAPYDRMIVTASAWDLPPAWLDQLAPQGILTLPLSIRGVDVSVAFEKVGPSRLLSRSVINCGFMPLRGAFGWRGRRISPAEGLRIMIDDDRRVDENALHKVIRGSRQSYRAGVEATSREMWNSFDFWLATVDPAFVRIDQDPEGVRAGWLPAPLVFFTGDGKSTALLSGESFAVVTHDDLSGDPEEPATTISLGVCGFGPDGKDLADRLSERIQEWDALGRPDSSGISIEVYPRGTPDAELAGRLAINKRHTRLAVSW